MSRPSCPTSAAVNSSGWNWHLSQLVLACGRGKPRLDLQSPKLQLIRLSNTSALLLELLRSPLCLLMKSLGIQSRPLDEQVVVQLSVEPVPTIQRDIAARYILSSQMRRARDRTEYGHGKRGERQPARCKNISERQRDASQQYGLTPWEAVTTEL